jgi:hypothetical protein
LFLFRIARLARSLHAVRARTGCIGLHRCVGRVYCIYVFTFTSTLSRSERAIESYCFIQSIFFLRTRNSHCLFVFCSIATVVMVDHADGSAGYIRFSDGREVVHSLPQ